jgi:hypothetical protein
MPKLPGLSSYYVRGMLSPLRGTYHVRRFEMKTLRNVLFGLPVVMVLGACQSSTPVVTPTDGQTYVKSVFPTGTFTAKDGDWVLTFDDDGSYTFSEYGTVEASGIISIQANELTWETDSYCDPKGAGKATYTWTFEDDVLLFLVKGEDKCVDRSSVIDNVAYHRQP